MEARKGLWRGPCRRRNRSKVARACSGLAEAAIERFLPLDEVYDGLQAFGLRPRHGKDPPGIHLRDSQYDEIAKMLTRAGRMKWACLPRTFVVLYQTGLENFMDAFIKDNRSDFYLPYAEDNLPDALSGEDRVRFLHYQDNILSEREFCGPGKELESGCAAHLHLKRSADNFFFSNRRVLGWGGSAMVEHVIGKSTLQDFALKRMSREHYFDDLKEKKNLYLFQNELNVLQRLKHKHIVKLVGSYTDHKFVGLLTQPVADKNLATFLKETPPPSDVDDHSIRLRSFFGCIATAIDYLHNNDMTRVQHKDIKPANILVKGSKVLIADFGTARSRTEDSTETTESTAGDTMRFLTRKYAAPEASAGTRTFASDIWSLGCVFLEMVTVLAGRSIDELQVFFRSTGSRSTVYHDNRPALEDWLQQLEMTLLASNFSEDAQLAGIVRLMCNHDQTKRPDSHDLVRRIFKLEGPIPYYGFCCSRRSQLSSPARSDSMDSMSTDCSSSDSSLEEPDAVMEEAHWVAVGSLSDVPALVHPPSNYISPAVEDSDTTIVAYNQPPKIQRHILEDVTELLDTPDLTSFVQEDSETIVAMGTGPKPLDPQESASDTVSGADAEKPLERQAPSSVPDSGNLMPLRTTKANPQAFEGNKGLACPWPKCKPPSGLALQLFDSYDSLHDHLLKVHKTHDFGRICLMDGSRDVPLRPLTLTTKTGALEAKNNSKPEERQVRFLELPRESRPRPKAQQVSRPKTTNAIYSINADMPTAPGQADAETMARCAKLGIPPTTFTPSYLLAAKNRFSQLEMLSQKTRFGRPLFVYGTLMFPSVLRCQSESFIDTDGTYSSQQGRRLSTSARDWNKIHESIQSAAECMTPAMLPGYRRFRLPSHSLAYVQRIDTSDEETPGFLVFGLSAEALACLDHLYEAKGPRKLFHERESRSLEWSRTRLSRKTATVRLNIVGGEVVNIEAEVFVAASEKDHLRENAQPWDINHFLRSRSFNALTNRLDDGKRIAEEDDIARTIGTRMVLPGDELVERVVNDDRDGVLKMLEESQCVDSPSAKYGTALQAAASKGNVDMMHLLLDQNASINASGGLYGNALIASVVHGHYDVMKLLLREDAKLFTPGGRHISALYQAVDFDRLDMVHALLEKGAWLTKDYREVLDLAAERNHHEIYDELVRYDVLDIHRQDRSIRDRSPTGSDVAENSKDIAVEQYTSIGAVCLWEAIRLHGQPGKWTGMKGVKVLRAGLDRGLDERLLEKIRPHIHSFPTIQKFFADAVGEAFDGRLKPVKHTDLVEDRRTEKRRKRRPRKLEWNEGGPRT